MSGVKSVSRHEEASVSGGSFAQQGGLNAQHNLAIRVSRTTCSVISTNLPSGWFYQRLQVLQNKQICGPYKINMWSYKNNGPNCAT